MSSGYCAFYTLLERIVALKVLHDKSGDDAEYVVRFRREARSVAQLSHPNIVTVIDRGDEDGKQFIVFEVIEGEKAERMLLATRAALEADGDLLEASEREAIGRLLDDLQRVREGTDHHVIDASVEALAHGTEAFAAERMNRGIRQALAGKRVEEV